MHFFSFRVFLSLIGIQGLDTADTSRASSSVVSADDGSAAVSPISVECDVAAVGRRSFARNLEGHDAGQAEQRL